MRPDTVIATHANTDFDALASMLAVRRLYPGSVVCVSGSLNRNVRELCRLYADELELVDASRLELDSVLRLIVVEAANASRLGELEPVALDPAVEKVVFDHHAGEAPDWARPENVVVSGDGALTTTLVGILAEREIAVSALEATVFALGIHEDTGSLTYPSATQRDADALSWCLRHGARQDILGRYLHTPLSNEERALLDALIDALETHELLGIDALVAAISWPSYVEGVSNLAHKIVDLTDARALVLLVEMDRRVFCVVRSRSPSFDAAAAAGALGGGGHEQAASAIYRGPLADARREILGALPSAVQEPLRARDVMSKPARAVGPADTIAAAMALCQRYNQSGVLVTDDGRLVGSVAREDLDRAIGHGLSHAPVKGIMSGRALKAGADAPLSELQQLLAESAEGRIAIVDGEAVAGVVTRRDVLRALDETAEPAHETGESIAAELRALPRLERAFDAIASASEVVEGVYLVGGTVRDILLGEASFDVDIAVEGDAIALARRIARELDGRTREHEKFGTAVVLYGHGERVDVVTARTEFYDAPAALPAVEHASIREDLYRRDFTINAMAASLKGEDFGRLVDPFGGRADLAGETLRVLHNLSFIEDPTRIFRAIRYENRYGFRMDEHTSRLARSCIEMGLVGDLSSARLRDELTALLEEGDVGHSLPRLAELGAAGAIHPHLAADDESVRLFDRGRTLARELHVDVPDWRLGLTVLARRMSVAEVSDWLGRLKLRRREADLVAAAVAVGPRMVRRLREEPLRPSEIVTMAEQYAPDAPLFAMALEELEPLRRYFEKLRHVRLEVAGADLAELGLGESPRVGEILAELRRRKLDGELDGRDAELAAARELIAAG